MLLLRTSERKETEHREIYNMNAGRKETRTFEKH